MAKAVLGAVAGAAMIALDVGFIVATGGLATAALPMLLAAEMGVLTGGISMIAGSIAQALTQNRGSNITVRQPASAQQIIYGIQRVGGISVYQSTTGSKHDQYNYIIVLAGHECHAIENLYLDGRQVFWDTTNYGNSTRNGYNFGGSALGGDHIGPGGQKYNFGGLVYCEARYGDQVDGDVIGAMTANDPTWAATSEGSPWLGGCTYVYLKVEYNTGMFPSAPEIKFTVHGKNNIWDPRTETTGYTSNMALIAADIFTDPIFGLGDNSVNQAQLIAAANVCDEQVALAAGGTESRYACHYHTDNATSPGDMLDVVMMAGAGRLSRVGGEWYIWPAYWQGPSATFDENALIGTMEWTPYRSYRDLINRVNGTYIAPNYPYNAAGNLYDTNGWYQGTTQNNFPFAFQPTNYPQYAADTLHGYASDAYLTADNDRLLPKELTLQSVLSVAQAQRLAKITLLRNRQQGMGTFEMSLAAWTMVPLDVMEFTFAEQGWTNKQLEITSVDFQINRDKDEVPFLALSVGVQECDQSVYEWSTTEELSVYDVPAGGLSTAPYTPDAPTGLTITSDSTTAVTGSDGVVTPRILATWTPANDASTVSTQIQYQESPSNNWTDCGTVDEATTFVYISGVVAGDSYLVRVRGIRSSGATSDWTVSGSLTIPSNVTSQINSSGLAPNLAVNTNIATITSVAVGGTSATLQVYGPGGPGTSYPVSYSGITVNLPSASITGLLNSTVYYLAWNTATSQYVVSTNYASTIVDSYIFIGDAETVAANGTGGIYNTGGRYENPVIR